MKDFTIQLTHRPGDLARVVQALSRRGLNVKAISAVAIGGQAVAHIIPDDVESARAALEAASIRFEESEVATVLLENRAGELARVTGRLAEENINLEAVYLTGMIDDLVEVAFVTDNPKKTKKLLEAF